MTIKSIRISGAQYEETLQNLSRWFVNNDIDPIVAYGLMRIMCDKLKRDFDIHDEIVGYEESSHETH